jgi:hypothetical protein
MINRIFIALIFLFVFGVVAYNYVLQRKNRETEVSNKLRNGRGEVFKNFIIKEKRSIELKYPPISEDINLSDFNFTRGTHTIVI